MTGHGTPLDGVTIRPITGPDEIALRAINMSWE